MRSWLQDSEPSTGPGTRDTEGTDKAQSVTGAARNQRCSQWVGAVMDGRINCWGGGGRKEGSGRITLKLGKTTSYKVTML